MASESGRGRETDDIRPFLDHARIEERLLGLGLSQHAVFSLRQLRAVGLSARCVSHRVAAGRLHRIHHGVYSLVPAQLLAREGRWMAAVLACGPDAVLSRRTAAALHGLRRTDRAHIDVAVPARSARKHRGIDVHRSTTLTPADVTAVNGIPCTIVARTLLDLAAVVRRRPVERAFDQAEMEEVLDLRQIEDQLRRNPNHPGARTVKAILEESYIGKAPTESELEEAMFALCRRRGLPLPAVNRWLDLGDGEPPIKADFLWRERRLILETDGAKFHGTHQARERDPRRDQRAVLAGWRPIRTTWRQVMYRPQELERVILRLVLGPPTPQSPHPPQSPSQPESPPRAAAP